MNQRLDALVSGRVQMVMFRDFVQRCARKRGLTGYVENLRDGNVHVIAEGPREKLDTFVECLHKGPLLAKVKKVHSTYTEVTGEFKRFEIKYA